ncbi:tetratricopeptide repeat protein [Dysgonomonas sp. HDW5B]|uniref:tetratricopeptide repeat protein n=1 Tax=Dysgonomonas sp. HDW5B TaxID=2714927 RepID=UPI00140C251C|nr:tetratricopeptide repeat protein [Dysgonomonas sp. HDW5B]QIK55907.1 tetratricopeptide repeat protein [Dysgonomonas sp. HDW5B]
MNRYFFIAIFFLVSFFSSAQTYEELVSKSLDYLDAKEYAAAELALKEAMRKEPANEGNILLLANLGTIQRHLGKSEEALISYSSALSKYPNNIFVLQNRAALYCELDSLNAAMKDYNIILSMDEKNIEALYRRGLIFMSEKNLLAAESDFEQILEINPENVLALSSLAFSLKSRGEWIEAEDKYTDLIFKYKNQPEFYVNRAECYLQLDKKGRAKSDLDKAQQLGYNDPLLYILKGQLDIHQFDKFSAKRNFEKALEMGANKEIIKQYLLLCK